MTGVGEGVGVVVPPPVPVPLLPPVLVFPPVEELPLPELLPVLEEELLPSPVEELELFPVFCGVNWPDCEQAVDRTIAIQIAAAYKLVLSCCLLFFAIMKNARCLG